MDIKEGHILELEGGHRHVVAIELSDELIESQCINADKSGLYGFGGMWYGDNPKSYDSFGKIYQLDHYKVKRIVGHISSFTNEEVKVMVN